MQTVLAENRAKLSAQETRLAHASRVNAMGEMASGMAHELAQPLTAILSQAQAGRRLARRGDTDRLADVLDDTVSQAQRASDILDRLRRWSKPNRAPIKSCALNDAVRERLATIHEAERLSGKTLAHFKQTLKAQRLLTLINFAALGCALGVLSVLVI